MSSRIPEEKIEEIRKAVDIVDVVNDYVQLRKQGKNYIGLCPFHGEKTPSFSVSTEKQLYHCFGCGAGGNVFSFLMTLEGFTFIETVKQLAARAKISLPEIAATENVNKKEKVLIEIHDLARKLYQYLLNNEQGKRGSDYLSDRGFSKEMIETFQIGYAPDSWDSLSNFLEKRKLTGPHLQETGLVAVREFDGKVFDRFRDRIMFPIWDSQGKPIAFGGRIIGEGRPKYLNSPETKIFQKGKILYGLHLARAAIRRENEVVLFEGYVDVIAAWGAGIKNGVATLGTALTEEQAKIIRRNAETVIICYDSDNAGTQAAFKASTLLEAAGCSVRVAVLPDGMDPDDFIQKFGIERFKNEIIGASLTLMAFKMQFLRHNRNLQDEGERMKYIDDALKEISQLTKAVERDHYVRQLADEFSLSLDVLKQEQYRIFRSQRKGQANDSSDKKHHVIDVRKKDIEKKRLLPAFQIAERRVLAYMMKDVSLSDKIQERIGGAFNMDEHHAIAAHLYAYYAEGNPPDASRFIQRLNDEKLMRIASEIALLDLSDDISEAELEDYLKWIENYPKWVEIEKKEIEKKEAEKQQNIVLAAQIAMEIIQMKQKLKK